MPITGPQARAARALIEWPRDKVASLAGVSVEILADFETLKSDPGEAARDAIQGALEGGGAVFLAEGGGEGRGVRLKWAKKEARQLNRMENEGGPVADDDV